VTGELRAVTNIARAASSGAGDVESLVGRLCASLADSFGFEQVEAYRHDLDRGLVQLLCGPAVPQPLDALFARTLETGRPEVADGRLVAPLPTADGIVGFLTAACETRPSEEQLELLSACAAVFAVSLQRALDHEELRRLGNLQKNFIALASHELRTPAAIVHGIAKTIEARADGLGVQRVGDLQETLVEHTERLTRLIDELLDLSRLDASGVPIEPQPVPVRSRIEEIVRSVAEGRTEQVEIGVDEDLVTRVDPKALDRIVGNLVTNALRYGEPPFAIRAHQQDRHFRLTVEDAGAGVSPGFVPHLFERFSRGDDAGPAVGAGLGLSIAQSYAQAHGGQLFYEDATPKGARFQLVLPAPHD
jgi:signal transduction histidine kinase